MNHFQRTKRTELFASQAVSGGATQNSSAVDTTGMSDIEIFWVATASAGAATAVKVQESDDGSTGWADVTGAALTTFPDTAGDFGSLYVSRSGTGHKQYLRFVWTQSASNAATVSAYLNSLPNNEAPTTTAERGNDHDAII
jgi:hypothetical protein